MKPSLTSTTTWTRPDGESEQITRATLRDANTLTERWATVATDALGEATNRLLVPGINAYDDGDYEGALSWFSQCVEANAAIEESLLYPHLHICRHVLQTELDPTDIERRNRAGGLRRLGKPSFMRCKWCGHYGQNAPRHPEHTIHAAPRCDRCDWDYFGPNFTWDTPDGLAYSYYRGSFSADGFYRWLEALFDIRPRRQR